MAIIATVVISVLVGCERGEPEAKNDAFLRGRFRERRVDFASVVEMLQADKNLGWIERNRLGYRVDHDTGATYMRFKATGTGTSWRNMDDSEDLRSFDGVLDEARLTKSRFDQYIRALDELGAVAVMVGGLALPEEAVNFEYSATGSVVTATYRSIVYLPSDISVDIDVVENTAGIVGEGDWLVRLDRDWYIYEARH